MILRNRHLNIHLRGTAMREIAYRYDRDGLGGLVSQKLPGTEPREVVPHRYLFGGKEYLSEDGRDEYFYPLRNYVPSIPRWDSMDRLAEKYYDISPYVFCGANPVLYSDLRGDSLYVSAEYRERLNNSLKEVFGDDAKNFEYTQSGMLVYKGKEKGLSRNQKKVLNGMVKGMTEQRTTYIKYEKTMQFDKNGKVETIDTSNHGGALTILASENPQLGIDYNVLLIDPNSSDKLNVLEVTSNFYIEPFDINRPGKFKSATIDTSLTDKFFHEIGHLAKEGKSLEKVIDYNNYVRSQLKMGKRKYDENHNFRGPMSEFLEAK